MQCGWTPTTFSDASGRAHYMLRCPFSLERMIRVTEQGTVIYLAEKKACRRFPKPASGDLFGDVARNFQVFDPLDFIAEEVEATAMAILTSAAKHVPSMARTDMKL